MSLSKIMGKYTELPKPEAVFNIQNVADYFFEVETEGFIDCEKDVYSYRLPFPCTAFEFKIPKSMRVKNATKTYIPTWMQEKGVNAIDKELITVPSEISGRSVIIIAIEKFNLLNGTGEVDFYVFGPINGNTEFWLARKYYCDIDGRFIVKSKQKDGKILLPTVFSDTITAYLSLLSDSDKEQLAIWNHPALMALNFLYCKNVSIQEKHIDTRLIKANIKRGKIRPYFEKYYTLQIEAMKKVLSNEGQAQNVGLNKAFHICRGHFKTYDVKPLFGKLKGTFWTPAHVKGNMQTGIVKKNYKI